MNITANPWVETVGDGSPRFADSSSIRFTALEKPALKDRLAVELRTAILTGKLAPGSRIVESTLAKQFNVAQSSIRESFQELVNQGFLVKHANRQTLVRKLNLADIEKLFRLRIELEGLAAELACVRSNEASVLPLNEECDRMDEAVRRDLLVDFYHHDLEFHRKFWRLADNEFLERALVPISVAPAAYVLAGTPIQWGATADDHREIVHALARDSAQTCRNLMASKVTKWLDMHRRVSVEHQRK